MNFDKIGGIIIVIILILCLGFTAYSTLIPSYTENQTTNNIILTESQFISALGSNDTTASDISTINLNIKQKTGGINIKFADNDKIYDIKSTAKNNTTKVEYGSNNDGSADINITSENAEQEIILNNKYTYNINGQIISGGVGINSTPNSKINSVTFDNTLGGYNIGLNGGTINNMDINMVVGGINIQGSPSGQTTMNSNISIGGITIKINKPVEKITSHIELGGSRIKNKTGTEYIDYQSDSYESSNDKFILNNYIKMGGLNVE